MSKHMPRSIELLSAHPGFRRVTVEQGLSGPELDSPPDCVAACFYTFDSIESFLTAFLPHAEGLRDGHAAIGVSRDCAASFEHRCVNWPLFNNPSSTSVRALVTASR